MSLRGRPQTSLKNEEAEHHEPNPMQQFINLLVGALQNMQPNNINMNPPSNPVATFKDFKNVGPQS